MALFLYHLLLLILLPVLLAALLIRSRSQKAYRQRINERLGFIPKGFKQGGIVIHGASVGEILGLRPLIDATLARWPDQPLTITTFTPTGSEQVQKLYGDKVQHCYLPIDVGFCVNGFLKRLKPKAIVLMETELWPVLIDKANKQKIALLLVNARLSPKSQGQYQKFSALVKPTLAKFDAILCQSPDNQARFLALGAPQNNTSVSGNLKYDIASNATQQAKTAELMSHIEGERKIIVAGSTHPGDEDLLINAYKELKTSYPELLLVVVPRHPERFSQVATDIASQDLCVVKRSENSSVNLTDDVWVIDTLGELLAVYALADVCVVGGSFSNKGGHNPLEAALFAKAIITGPDMVHFTDMNTLLIEAGGIWQLKENHDLTNALTELLEDQNRAITLGQQALGVVKANQGATGKSIDTIAQLINIRFE